MIYADNNGTKPLSDEVKEYLLERLNGPFANPNAIHSLGCKVKSAMEKCRKICAEELGAAPNQIIFNSGSSEGISQVFYSIFKSNPNNKKLISSPIEHSAVINSIKNLEEFGFSNTHLEVNTQGKAIIPNNKEQYALATLMASHNETGVNQDFVDFGNWCKSTNTPYFCDTTQIYGKMEFNFNQLPVDYAVLSGHKIGAPTGCGILLVKNPENLKAFIHGGGQESYKRGGTQNYIGIECLTVAVQGLKKQIEQYKKIKEYRKHFENSLKAKIPELVIIGDEVERIPNTTLLSIPGIHSQALQIELESKDIFVTTSSACSDNEPSTSRTLKAMGIPDTIGRSVIRISSSEKYTPRDYQDIESAIVQAHQKLSKIKTQ